MPRGTPAVWGQPHDNKAELVQRIKAVQRTSAESKQRWVTYCEMHGHRKHDPNVHDENFLSQFFEALCRNDIPLDTPATARKTTAKSDSAGDKSGTSPDAPESETSREKALDPKEELVQRVKQVQRAGTDGKHKWIWFCESRGQKKHDPAVHDEDFLNAFFRHMENGDIPADETGKTELVQKIKDLQRKDPLGKVMWTEYCDHHGQGKHDPKIYDVDFLRSFLDGSEGLGQAQSHGAGADGGDREAHMTSYMQMVAAEQANLHRGQYPHPGCGSAAMHPASQGGVGAFVWGPAMRQEHFSPMQMPPLQLIPPASAADPGSWQPSQVHAQYGMHPQMQHMPQMVLTSNPSMGAWQQPGVFLGSAWTESQSAERR